MTLPNPLFLDPNHKGHILDVTEAGDAGFTTGAWDVNLGPGSFTLNPAPYSNLPIGSDPGARSGALHMDAVVNVATGRHFLFATTGPYVAIFELTANDVVHLQTFPGLGSVFSGRSVKGEAEAISVGSEVRFAYTTFLAFDNPGTFSVGIRYLRFDAATPSFPQIGAPLQYSFPLAPLPIDAENVLGEPIAQYRISGLEFAPTGNYIYWWIPKITGAPFSLGCIDLQNNVFLDLVEFAPEFVDSEMELGVAPGGNNAALYLCGKDALGNAMLGALIDPNTPLSATWDPNVLALSNVAQSAELLGLDRYHLLSAQVNEDPSNTVLNTPICCDARFLATSYTDLSIPAGTDTWTTSDNPFCDRPIARIDHELRFSVGSHIVAQNMRFEFGPDATLIIEPGASFTCVGCTLTTACPGYQWRGVEVQGNLSEHQYGGSHPDHQGELTLTNSHLQNAMVGALLCGRGSNGNIQKLKSGGVIQCTNSTFQNCRTGVQFMPYQGTDVGGTVNVRNLSRFKNTTFTVDTDYPVAFDFNHHAYLWYVDGIPFNGCTFNNLRTSETNSHQLGYGIYSLDAHYEVRERCNVAVPLGQECPVGSFTPSAFTGLDHGIHALTSLSSRAFVVDRAAFDANVCGVYANGVVGYRVTRSNFTVGNSVATTLTNLPTELNWLERHRGIFTTESYGFWVDDNTLTQGSPGTSLTEGIVLGYTRDHNDKARRNTASGLEVGFIGEGICADAYNYLTNTIGLQYLCNTNNGNDYNFWDRKVDADVDHSPAHTMRTNQGEIDTPADNVFDQTCGFEGHYKRTSPNGVLRYIYGTAPQATPLCYTIVLTSPVAPQPAVDEPDVPCAQRNYLPRGVRSLQEAQLAKTALLTERTAYGTTRYIYDQLLDGGSTDEVVQEISSTWPSEAWELRTYLLDLSPFLSVDALKEMVERNVMPAAMVAEVLIANPDATRQGGFMDWLQLESGHALPPYLLSSVVASWDQTTYRYSLETLMGQHHAAMTQHAHGVMDYWRSDTLHENVDSLRAVWQLVRTPAGRYAEALTYLQAGNTGGAYQVVNAMPDEQALEGAAYAERQRMLELIAFCATIYTSERTMAELTTGEVDQLEAIVAEAYDRPATWAQNLLCFAYERCRTPLTGGDGQHRPAFNLTQAEQMTSVLPELNLAPNPGQNWTVASYRSIGTGKTLDLVLRDISGRVQWRNTLGNTEGQALIDLRGLAPGAYTVELLASGALVASRKLIVQP